MPIESEKPPILSVYYEGTDLGGVSSVIEMIINGTASAFPTGLVCSDSSGLQKWREAFKARNVKVITAAVRNKFDFFGWFDFPNLFRLLRFVRRSKILHCHLHTTFSCVPVIILAGIFTRLKIIVTEHYVTQIKFLRRRKLSRIKFFLREIKIAVLTFSKKISLRFIDMIVVVSQANRRFMIETFGQSIDYKIKVIANGINPNLYSDSHNLAANHGITSDTLGQKVVVVAGLNNQKGHEYLFRSIPIVLRRIPNAKFILVGDGHLRSYLEDLASSLGITNAVTFMGFRSDVADIVRTSDLFVLPSIFEGMPLSVIEAMACSKAVVATNVDGTAELVADNVTGYLVAPRDTEQLAEKIIELLENTELRIQFGKAGKERAKKFFSADRMIQEYERLYKDLVENVTNA